MQQSRLPYLAAATCILGLVFSALTSYGQAPAPAMSPTPAMSPAPAASPTPAKTRRRKAAAAATPAPTATPATTANAAGATPAAAPTPAVAGKPHPFHGKVASVDTAANSFTIAYKTPQTVYVTSETKIKKNGAPAQLTDAVVGEDCGGRVVKGPDGKLTALSVRFGAKPDKAAETAAPATAPAPKP